MVSGHHFCCLLGEAVLDNRLTQASTVQYDVATYSTGLVTLNPSLGFRFRIYLLLPVCKIYDNSQQRSIILDVEARYAVKQRAASSLGQPSSLLAPSQHRRDHCNEALEKPRESHSRHFGNSIALLLGLLL